jgi:hypothetical protein
LEEGRLIGCTDTSEKSHVLIRRDDVSKNQVMNSSIQKGGNKITIIIRVQLTLIAGPPKKRKKKEEREKPGPL